MYGKLFLCLAVFGLSAQCAQGGGPLKPLATGAKAEKMALNAGRNLSAKLSRFRRNIVYPNKFLGTEALRLQPSFVGVGDYTQRARRFNMLNQVIPAEKLEKFLPKSGNVIKPLDGYIFSFKKVDVSVIRNQQRFFARIYGDTKRFQGVFVKTFEELRQFSYMGVKKPEELSAALENAIKQGQSKETGFLALLVEGNAYRPKDILIWDEAAQKWISYNQSKAEVLRYNIDTMRAKFAEDNQYWASLIQERGVLIRPDNYEDPSSVRVSLDGLNWQEFSIFDQTGADLWDAWNENLYISYDRHQHKAWFSETKDAKKFASLLDLNMFRRTKAAGFSIKKCNSGEMEIDMDAHDFPNLFIRSEGGELSPVKSLTVDVSFPEEPVTFLNELKELVNSVYSKDPARRMIFLKDVAEKGEFYDASDCVEYLSKDGTFSLLDLDDLEALEQGL